MKKYNILCNVDNGGSAYHRVILPMKALQGKIITSTNNEKFEINPILKYSKETYFTEEDLEGIDCIWISKQSFNNRKYQLYFNSNIHVH
mgnify:CR=1 FL=1